MDDISDLQTLSDGECAASSTVYLSNTWNGREFSGRYSLDAGIPQI